MNKLEDIVYKNLLYIINKYKIFNFLLSFSGGIDSTVLLFIIKKIKLNILKNINLRVIHINHNLNNFSNVYENHCLNFCKHNNIEIISKKVNINEILIKKLGIEYYCRLIRYKSIKKNINKNEILVTAHHKNDNIETFFLFLNRGSGSNGLSCIKKINKLFNINIIRPLLNIKKSDIVKYANKNKIFYIDDITNNDENIIRNFIRKKINNIELKLNGFINSCSKSIKIISEENKILEKYIYEDIKENIKNTSLDYSNFKKKKYNNFNIKLIIKLWLKKFNIISTYKNLDIINNQIIKSSINANPLLKINNVYIIRHKKKIHFIHKIIKKKNFFNINWNNNNRIYLPNKIGYLEKSNIINIKKKNKFIYIKIRKNFKNENISIQISTISYNEKIKTIDFDNKKKIKKLWNLYNIPSYIRNQIPLLFYNNNLISAIGVFITDYAKNINNNNFIYIKLYKSPIKKFLKNKFINN